MPSAIHRPPQLAGTMFRGADVIRAGLLTKDHLRSRHWRRLFRGIYMDATIADSHRHRCLAASRYLLPPGAAIAGRSAAWLYGVRLRNTADPVDVVTPRTTRFGPIHGLSIHVAELTPDDTRTVDGLPCTAPLRTGWDLAGWLSLPAAVAYLDVMAAQKLLTPPTLAGYAHERAGVRGWRRVLRAASLIDPAAESPQESRLRVQLVQAGLPGPVSQYVITQNGRFVARVDLAWPELQVAVEYDGRWHDHPDQLHADRARLNRLVTADGWIVLHVTSRRLREDLPGFAAEVRAALRSQRARRVRPAASPRSPHEGGPRDSGSPRSPHEGGHRPGPATAPGTAPATAPGRTRTAPRGIEK